MPVNLTIAVIGAMDCEIAKLKELMKDVTSIRANQLTIYKGKIKNHTVVLVKSGVGKVNGALCTQYIADNFKPDYIINTGIAGGLADNLKTGDIVIGEKLVQHDFDATDLGYAKGYMCTGTEKDKPTVYYSDKELIEVFEKAMNEFHPEARIYKGIAATGDMFIGSLAKKRKIKETFNAVAAEMEGAAIAQTANLNNIPCIIIRAVADLADGSTCDSIDRMAADCAANAVSALLKYLRPKEKLFEKQLSSQVVYEGKVFNVTSDEAELSDGRRTKREVVHHKGGVVIAAEYDNKILMVRQFRYAVNDAIYELPAGKLDKPDEDILSAAKRELEEETGYNALDWQYLGFIWTTPGFCSEKLYLFKASNLQFKGQHLDEGEILNAMLTDKEEVFQMIKDGIINDSKTISALMRAYKL